MADDRLVTGDAVELDARPASFALRAASAAIDVLSTLAVAGLAVWLVVLALPDGDRATVTATLTVVLVAIIVLVPAVVESASRGRSLGRLATGLRIVRDDGGPIAFRHAFVRALTGVLELYLTLGGTAAVVGLLSARTKRLGDHLAGTYAMAERVPRPVPYAAPVPAELTAWAAVADVARLPDALARRIATFLRQAPGMQPVSRAELAAALAEEAAPFAHPLPAGAPEAFLTAVAALRREREAVALARQDAVLHRLEPVLTARRGLPDRG